MSESVRDPFSEIRYPVLDIVATIARFEHRPGMLDPGRRIPE
jgi:hypothetical protein